MNWRNWLAPKHVTTKASAAGPVVAWSQPGQPRWTPRRYDALAEAGYRKNVVVYRCVSMIAQAVAGIPWLLYDRDGHELDHHPVLDLLERPNPLQDGMTWRESLVGMLLLSGNAYVEAVRPADHLPPRELYALRPDRMKVVPGSAGVPQAYEYAVNNKAVRWPADPISGASNILHIKSYHPLDDWYGLAPLEAAMLAVDQHNAAGAWNKAMLDNGARPSGALVFAPKEGPATLTEEQVRRLREELDDSYQGSRNAGRPLVLEGGLQWQTMSLSPSDMDWLRGRDIAAREIALAFGVPGQLIGLPDAQTYSNLQEARLALYEETIIPLAERMTAAFNHWLMPMVNDHLTLALDHDAVVALANKRDTLWDKVGNAAFLTINEKREALGYSPLPDGDRLPQAKADILPKTF